MLLAKIGEILLAPLWWFAILCETLHAEDIFHVLLNLTVNGGWAILAVLAARLVLQKAPRKYAYVLWAVAAFRLVCPVSFPSLFSLLPSAGKPAVPYDIGFAAAPQVNTGSAAVDHAINAVLPAPDPQVLSSVNPLQVWMFVLAVLWVLGVLVLAVCAAVSTLRLARRVKTARLLPMPAAEQGPSPLWGMANAAPVYALPGAETAFVFGVLRPRIYLPEGLSPAAQACVLAHERTHISRADHIIKLAAFCVLCAHWFNPLVWLAWFCMERDMEHSCDEATLRRTGQSRVDYAQSLLNLTARRRPGAFSPVAFGESGVAAHIKNVLNYKRPAFWVSVAALAAVLVLGFGLAADPAVTPLMQAQAAVDAARQQPVGRVTIETIAETNTAGVTEHRVEEKLYQREPLRYHWVTRWLDQRNAGTVAAVYWTEDRAFARTDDGVWGEMTVLDMKGRTPGEIRRESCDGLYGLQNQLTEPKNFSEIIRKGDTITLIVDTDRAGSTAPAQRVPITESETIDITLNGDALQQVQWVERQVQPDTGEIFTFRTTLTVQDAATVQAELTELYNQHGFGMALEQAPGPGEGGVTTLPAAGDAGTLRSLGSGQSAALSKQDARLLADLLAQGSWNTEGTADCLSEYEIELNGEVYLYHASCGTFNDNKNNRSLTVDKAVCAQLNEQLAGYGLDASAQ
ncbi:MAG: hypothetical protein IJ347_08050 [Faecalibacterium sp.]|nr:hypothetical protein [Faecalibacterium sp.]